MAASTTALDELPPHDAPPAKESWIMRFPNTAFGVSLGLCGNSIMWNAMGNPKSFTADVGMSGCWFFWLSGLASFILISIVYLIKCIMPASRQVVVFEWKHPVRRYFFITPVLAILMLTLGAPKDVCNPADWNCLVALRILWVFCAFVQTALTHRYYVGWMFGKQGHLGQAGTPYLLCVVGWFLLCVLAFKSKLREWDAKTSTAVFAWGLDLPAFCFGIGLFFFIIAIISIFQGFHDGNTAKGHPALFLILAPPNVAAACLAKFQGGFMEPSQCILGFSLLMFCLLMKQDPDIHKKPEVFGVYWAYVFPMAALGGTAVMAGNTPGAGIAAKVLGWILTSLATLCVVIVFCRMSYHALMVCRYGPPEYQWADPLYNAFKKKKKEAAESAEALHGEVHVTEAHEGLHADSPNYGSMATKLSEV